MMTITPTIAAITIPTTTPHVQNGFLKLEESITILMTKTINV